MKVEVDSSGLEKLAAKLEKLATGAQERLQRPAKQGAERIVATAKGNVYQNGLHYTVQAIEAFQRDHGLTVDGLCGPKTWAVLKAA